jgi:hypothetical protein
MRPNTVFLVAAVLASAFGLSFLLAPGMVLPLYAIQADAPTVLMSRFFGVALLHLGLLLWFIRDVRDAGALRALGLAGVIGSAVGVAVALLGVLGGGTNALGWSTVAIYGALLFGYLGVLRAHPELA